VNEHEVVTIPGPGGSSISCCIIPLGCVVVLLAVLLVGVIGLALRLPRRTLPVATPIARNPSLLPSR